MGPYYMVGEIGIWQWDVTHSGYGNKAMKDKRQQLRRLFYSGYCNNEKLHEWGMYQRREGKLGVALSRSERMEVGLFGGGRVKVTRF